MKKLFTSDNRFLVNQIKDMLDEKGILCFIKNEFAAGAMGELAPQDCDPEVWLHDDEWYQTAKREIAQLEINIGNSEQWQCATCNEVNEASFQICWQCQQSRELDD